MIRLLILLVAIVAAAGATLFAASEAGALLDPILWFVPALAASAVTGRWLYRK
ncbi:hypothetical protein [Palleronia caenipelagi]|uniref:hypothetical protein n=1 Tax=Palleronia caenipelagi TaxID=2489174 RepID=UPI001FEAC412|nr:hypothetical protein [Palleronia caenipelagi]